MMGLIFGQEMSPQVFAVEELVVARQRFVVIFCCPNSFFTGENLTTKI